jgi:hypothetical protein
MDWEAYFDAAFAELVAFCEVSGDPRLKDFLRAKIADAILLSIARCHDGTIPQQAVILGELEERCRAKARG